MSKFKFVLNRSGVRELMKSDAMADECLRIANEVAGRAGEGYVAHPLHSKNRTGAVAAAGTRKAGIDNYKRNTLLKALGN